MTAVLISGPAVEPVSLDEAKAHLRVDSGDEDTLISSLIAAARLHVESHIHRVLITQTWSIFLDKWPLGQPLRLPLSPVQSVTAINIYAADDSFVPADPINYVVDAVSFPPRVLWRGSGSTPCPGRQLNGIEIVVTAGFGNNGIQVPQTLRQAILMMIALWFEHRQPPTLNGPDETLPPAVASLLQPYAPVRL